VDKWRAFVFGSVSFGAFRCCEEWTGSESYFASCSKIVGQADVAQACSNEVRPLSVSADVALVAGERCAV
jgi:hypothetical protein